MKPLIILLFLLCQISIAGTIDPNTSDKKYIEYGKNFTYIYRLFGNCKDGTVFNGSAVAIDKNWLLTAAHVVNQSELCLACNDDDSVIITDIIIPNQYQEKNFGIADIALCYVKHDLGLDFYPGLYIDNNETNKICSISGYGATGTFDTGIKIFDNKKRAGSNKIDYIDREMLICSASKHNRTTLEFLIGSGDSGGGLFIDGRLAGINSCVLAGDKKTDSGYGDESGHTRVSLYVKWIQKIMKDKNEKK